MIAQITNHSELPGQLKKSFPVIEGFVELFEKLPPSSNAISMLYGTIIIVMIN